jgi:hypothetical protein
LRERTFQGVKNEKGSLFSPGQGMVHVAPPSNLRREELLLRRDDDSGFEIIEPRVSFLSFPLFLSRACLGKVMKFLVLNGAEDMRFLPLK